MRALSLIISCLLPFTCIALGIMGISRCLTYPVSWDNVTFLVYGLVGFGALPFAVLVAIGLGVAVCIAESRAITWIGLGSLCHMALVPWSLYAGRAMDF